MPNENKKSGPSAGSGPCAPVAWVARGKGAELGAGGVLGKGTCMCSPPTARAAFNLPAWGVRVCCA